MIAEKERTADAGTPAIQKPNQISAESVIENLWAVNEDSVTNDEELVQILKEQFASVASTNEQRMYFVGKLYELRKSQVSAGGVKRDASGLIQSNSLFPCTKHGKYRETADYVAEEIGLSATTVKRYGLYTKGIDAVFGFDKDVARSILNAERKVRSSDLVDIGMADPSDKREMVEGMVFRRPVRTERVVSRTRKRKEDYRKIEECVSHLFGDANNEYTKDSLIRDIRINSEPFVSMIGQLLSQHSGLCRENLTDVIRTINEEIIFKIEEIEEDLRSHE